MASALAIFGVAVEINYGSNVGNARATLRWRNKMPLIARKFSQFLKKRPFFHHLYYGLVDKFTSVEIETTTICNRECPYCPNALIEREAAFMEVHTFEQIMNQLAEIGYSGRLHLHRYGEPLIDERLPLLVSTARKKLPSALIYIYTNGDFLTLEKFRTLIKRGVDFFVITQHYNMEQKCSNNHQQEPLERLFEQLDPNEHEKLEYNVMAKGNRLFNRGGTVPLTDLWPVKNCIMATRELEIDHEGNILLCCNQFRAEDGPIFGNLLSEPIMSIWEKSSYKNLRRDIRKGKYTLDICKRCGRGIWN